MERRSAVRPEDRMGLILIVGSGDMTPEQREEFDHDWPFSIARKAIDVSIDELERELQPLREDLLPHRLLAVVVTELVGKVRYTLLLNFAAEKGGKFYYNAPAD